MLLNNLSVDPVYVIAPLPTYLKEFLRHNDKVNLVYNKTGVLREEDNTLDVPSVPQILENDNNESELELTGNPLQVDLNGDDSLSVSINGNEKPQSWTEEESKHFPMSSMDARKLINNFNTQKSVDNEASSIYCVCNGEDAQCTVIIGSEVSSTTITTMLVNIVGLYHRTHELASLDYMVQDHLSNLSPNTKVEYLVRSVFAIYGYNLRSKKNLTHTEYNGSISLEVCHDKCVYDIPQDQTKMKMICQVIAGHQSSTIFFMWEQLCLLQSYLDILSDSELCNCETTIISKDYKSLDDVTSSITNLLQTVNHLEREAYIKLNLSKIRHETVLDKLWNVLKHCKDLSDLRDAFVFLFEELTETEIKTQVEVESNSTISMLINGFIAGKLAVHTFSFAQSLEFLFELGVEKLKNDYVAIMNYSFPAPVDAKINKQWSKYNDGNVAENFKRKSRMSLNPKLKVTDSQDNTHKLAYLGQIHVAVELLFLSDQHFKLEVENFDYFLENLSKEYFGNCTGDFSMLQHNPLGEFSIYLNLQSQRVQGNIPVTWSMEMSSSSNMYKKTTIFHMSQYPIFPKVIFDNYDASISLDEKMPFYITKFQQNVFEI